MGGGALARSVFNKWLSIGCEWLFPPRLLLRQIVEIDDLKGHWEALRILLAGWLPALRHIVEPDAFFSLSKRISCLFAMILVESARQKQSQLILGLTKSVKRVNS